jgi:UDP-glucose 4-epimerase
MRVLVTGATGFVGVNIVRTLALQDDTVVATDLREPNEAAWRYLRGHESRVTFVAGDVRAQALQRDLAGRGPYDGLIHAAVITAVNPDFEMRDPVRMLDVNVLGTAHMLELARAAGVPRFLYVSSGSVYGTLGSVERPLTEDGPTSPAGLYGVSKYASELVCRRYAALFGLDLRMVRLTSPFGPMERQTGAREWMSVPYTWTHQALRGEVVRAANLECVRDYLYVEDVTAGIVAALKAGAPRHPVYNLGSGVAYRLSEVLETLARLVPGMRHEVVPAYPEFNVRPENTRGPLDVRRAREDLGFAPQHDLAGGLQKYLDWLRDPANLAL